MWEDVAGRFFPNQDAMIRWIRQPVIVPFLDRVPVTAKEAFMKMVVQEMIQRTQQPDGRCFEHFRRLQVFARK